MSQASWARPPLGPDLAGGVLLGGLGLTACLLAAVHVTQGTSAVDAGDLLTLVAGDVDPTVRDVLWGSRLPRLAAAVVVGVALGAAGTLLQSVARNPLASPDTLAVNAGAHLAVVATAALGLSLPVLPAGGVALLGGLLAAGLVLTLGAGGGPLRLILAGSAAALALHAVTRLLLLMFEQETVGLFAWGEGSLTQVDLRAAQQMAPVVVIALVAAMLLARPLDLLGLGDDQAAVLGVHVRRTQLGAVLLAVTLSAAAVTLAGPLGFVGLAAPAAVRLLVRRVPALTRHALLLPAAAIAGVAVVLAADVGLRLVLDAGTAIMVPTGVVTTVVGAAALVALARQRAAAGTHATPAPRVAPRSPRRHQLVVAILALAVPLCLLIGMLLGDTAMLLGDLTGWLRRETGPAYTFVLDSRLPRVLAALAAGAALALAGATVQAVCRNPLAEPGLLGITAGAGLGAIVVLTVRPGSGIAGMTLAAGVAAVLTFGLVYALAWRRTGLASERLVLVGVGVAAIATSLTSLVILVTDPWNTTKALTWLAGSTYGRTMAQVLPVAAALLVLGPLCWSWSRRLDLVALGDDVPRVLGVRLERFRLSALAVTAVLTATAVSAVGVVGFVGLVAPHAARALVGGLHARVLPVAALLGACLVSLADTVGRTVIAPAQMPAGLVTALVGTPYFLYLLRRSRR